MNCKTHDDVLKSVHDLEVGFIQFWFTDVLGVLKSFVVTPQELEVGLNEGMGFDGSSIEGFARIEESDLVAMPDPCTFQLLPWEDNGVRIARLICDVVSPDGQPYEGDSRYVLKRMLKKATDMGYTWYAGPELEFFYFKERGSLEPVDDAGYFDGCPLDLGDPIRRKTILALQQMGISVEYDHHEVAPSQHEIDLRYSEGMVMADIVMTYRMLVKEVARRNGVYATFMPKPIFGENGSGMHTHQSLFKGDRNEFYNPDDMYNLSDIAKSYTAGLLKHAREITLVNNQWVNSYKRLVPGFEAPAYISWARRNRSAMVRIPMYKPGKEKATRIEYRAPDPACNPYLAFATQLAVGLEGMEQNYVLGDPIEEDIFDMTPSERKDKGIGELPGNLYAAIQATEQSEIVRKALGDHIFNKFLENKKIEWDKYRVHVSRYEIDNYLSLL